MHTMKAKTGARWTKRLSALGVLAASWLLAPAAHASLSYLPYLVINYSYTGDCTLCHTDNNGGENTVTKAFGKALMEDYGLGPKDDAKLKEVFAQITADGHDTDGDMASDIEEISGGGNPNDPAVLPGGFEPPVQPEYGCVGTIAGGKSSSDAAALAASVLVALALVFKRRLRVF